MAVLNPKETYKSLLKKGFKKRSGDHKYVHFYEGEKATHIYTKISHNNKDIDDYLIQAMAKQIKLSKKEFILFAECTLKHEEYLEILKTKKEL